MCEDLPQPQHCYVLRAVEETPVSRKFPALLTYVNIINIECRQSKPQRRPLICLLLASTPEFARMKSSSKLFQKNFAAVKMLDAK